MGNQTLSDDSSQQTLRSLGIVTNPTLMLTVLPSFGLDVMGIPFHDGPTTDDICKRSTLQCGTADLVQKIITYVGTVYRLSDDENFLNSLRIVKFAPGHDDPHAHADTSDTQNPPQLRQPNDGSGKYCLNCKSKNGTILDPTKPISYYNLTSKDRVYFNLPDDFDLTHEIKRGCGGPLGWIRVPQITVNILHPTLGRIFPLVVGQNISISSLGSLVSNYDDPSTGITGVERIQDYYFTFTGRRVGNRLILPDCQRVPECGVLALHLKSKDNETKIFVKTLMGTTLTMDINLDDTVEFLKDQIHLQEGIPPEQQRLIFTGQQLDDWYTLNDYNIKAVSTLHLLLRLKGC